MKKFVLALMLIPSLAFSHTEELYDIPFSTTRTTVDVRRVPDVTQACNAERTKRNLPTFKQPSMACSFWTSNTCLIIVRNKNSNDDLGHELRHCLSGKFH